MNNLYVWRHIVPAKLFAVVTIVSLIMSAFPAHFFVAYAVENEQGQPEKVNICKANQGIGSFAPGVKEVSTNAVKNGLANSGINGDIVEYGQNWDFIYPSGLTGEEIFNAGCVIPTPDPTSDLRICKIIVDDEGNIVDGSGLDTDFSVRITGPEGFDQTVTFSTELGLNTDLVTDNGTDKDAECTYIKSVTPGEYLYEAEVISGDGTWGAPLYHDFYTGDPDELADFSELTVDGGNPDNDDADGVMNLSKNKTRTLAIVNTETGPTPNPLVSECIDPSLNLLDNGSFETPVVTATQKWSYLNVPDWLTTALDDQATADLELHRGWEGNFAVDGEQYAELDARESVKIAQTPAVLAGGLYELSWAFAPRHNINANENQLSVMVDGVEVATAGPATLPKGLEPLDWTRGNHTFTATGNSVEIAFADAGATSNSFGTFLDDARLCLVREPQPEVEVVITKIICEDESLLPNGGYESIDENTAQLFLAGLSDENREKCRLATEDEFEFQWALGGVNTANATDNEGELGDPWQTPVATDVNGKATVIVPASILGNTNQLSVREVMDTDYYLPFSGVNGSNESAELYCHTDAGNFDNLEWIAGVDTDNTYHCVAWNVPLERESDVTMCKYDDEQNPLSGWTLMLLGEEVDSLEVPADTDAGVDSVALTGGLSYVAIANGTWENDRGPLNIVDAEYSTEDTWLTWMDGFLLGFPTDILELFIGNETDPASDWGTYNSNHRYAQSFVPGGDGPVNFSINDTNYADNTGSLDVDLYTGYAGITGENGCVTFEDVPYGTYNADEVMLDDWKNLSGLGEIEIDEEETQHAIINKDISRIPVATLVAEKVVCEAEEYLPNWHDDENKPDMITETTASQYVADSEGKCWLEDDWYFEWASEGTDNPDNKLHEDNPLYGAGGTGWTQFGPTDGTDKAQVSLTAEDLDDSDSHIWVREVLQEDPVTYIPFTYGPNNQTNADNETAELYCHTDIKNYDNYDRVDGITVDNTYHCVAFNAEIEKPVVQCELDIYSDIMTLVEETNKLATSTYDGNKAWTADIPGATWIWATKEVENPAATTTYTFVETFEVENPTEGSLVVAYDNWLKFYVNGKLIDDRTGTNGYQYFQKQTYELGTDFNLQPGENRIELEVTNEGKDGEDYLSNPAGVLFHLSAKGDEDTCERTTKPEPDEMYLIDGFKYEVTDNGTTTLAGWNIYAENTSEAITLATSTDENGYYYFEVTEGYWEVTEEVQTNWDQVQVEQNGELVVTEGENNGYCGFESYQEDEYQCDFFNTQRDDDVTIITTTTRGGGGGGTRVREPATAQELVAGAATSFCPFLEDYMQIGTANDSWEVMKLQMFLSIIMGETLEVNGEFDATTDAAVKRFQERYQDEILTPWFERGIVPHDDPTGYVYKTTRWKINDIVCPGYEPYPSFDGEDLQSNINLD